MPGRKYTIPLFFVSVLGFENRYRIKIRISRRRFDLGVEYIVPLFSVSSFWVTTKFWGREVSTLINKL